MPTTRPADKGKDRSQWWKDASPEQQEGETTPGPTANDKAAAGKKKFDEEQEAIKHPT